jgi:hypothetical protein
MPSREERRARNEVTFRSANEAIVRNVGTSTSPKMLPLICECGSEDCLEEIELTAREYEVVRASPIRFAVLPGHEDEDEDLLDAFDRFSVVQKKGEGEQIVRELNPRDPP